MKTRHPLRFILLALTVAVGAGTTLAAGGPPAGTATCCENGECACAKLRATEDLSALERFLDMGDEQLDRIQQAVAKVRAMTAEERAALHAQLHAFRQLPPAQRERVRAGWRNDRDHTDWPQMMRSLPEAERAAIQAEIQNLAPVERALRKHELLEAWRGAPAPAAAGD